MTLISFCTLGAQTVDPDAENENNPQGNIVELSAFEVESTEGGGYVSHHSVSGFRSRKALMDIPQAITVIPRDLVDDLGQFRNEVDIVKYAAAGVSAEHKAGQPHMRGFRAQTILEDGVWDNQFNNSESVNADSYEVLRGPAAVLYGGRPTLAGIIMRNTKKPEMTPSYMVRGIAGTENFYRAEFDATGPISDSVFGSSAKLSYRFVAAIQRDDGFPSGDTDDRDAFFPSLQLEFPQTVFRLSGESVDFVNGGQPLGFLKEDLSGLYVGSDRGRDQLWKEKWSQATFTRDKVRLDVEHQFNENWDMRVVGYKSWYDRRDFDIRMAGHVNYNTMTIDQMYFHNGNDADLSVVSFDLVGKYELFGVSHESFFGLYGDRQNNDNFRSTYPLRTISIVNPVFDRTKPVVPADASIPYRGNQGDTAFISYSHTLSFFEDKLSLVAGLARNYVYNNSYDIDVATGKKSLPTFEQTVVETTHRFGVVYRPIQSVSFFLNNSSTFLPQTNQDVNGNFLDSTEGEVVDIGVKFNTANERLVGTVTYFDLTASNIRVQDFANPGFWMAAGENNNKGIEIELAVKPTENSQIIATYYKGDIKDTDTGERLNNSVNETYSLIGKYSFNSGLSLGLTMFHQGYRQQAGNAGWPAWTVWNAFATYQVNESLHLALNVENLGDTLYSPGGFDVTRRSNIGAPRNAKLTATFRF